MKTTDPAPLAGQDEPLPSAEVSQDPPAEKAPAKPAKADQALSGIEICCVEEDVAFTGDHPLAGLWKRGDLKSVPQDVSLEVAEGLIAAGIARTI